METKDWLALKQPKALLIGHDPRLQKYDAIAEYALYADYYFQDKVPTTPSEKQKYGLAKSSFDQIAYLTNGRIAPENVYMTNLCNSVLEHATPKKTVLIPLKMAQEGLNNIRKILASNPSIKFIFPMSLQVNYWLQKLGFYNSGDDFLSQSEPKVNGINNDPPYYDPKKSKSFQLICGKIFETADGKNKIIPILHSKNFPLKDRFLDTYGMKYEHIRGYFSDVSLMEY
jgi:hypothetical protein